MKIIINCTNLAKGGGIQVALAFLAEYNKIQTNEYYVIYSNTISEQLNIKEYNSNFYFYNIEYSPINIKKRLRTIKRLNELEKKIQPDFVFSIFGPTYWKPKNPHIMGYAIPHYIYPESPFWKTINIKTRLCLFIKKWIIKWQIKNNAKYYYIETLDAKERFSKYFNIPKSNIIVANNTYHPVFKNIQQIKNSKTTTETRKEFILITISSYYKHKNLEIINDVIKEIEKDDDIFVKFLLTLPEEIFIQKFEKSKHLINLGHLKIEECPGKYSQVDALFLPSLLEVFSANYVEAMKMEKPILTSNLSFAKNVCQDAAYYFDPLNAKEIANSILSIAKNDKLRKNLIEAGLRQLSKYDNSAQRAKKILDFGSMIITK